MNKKIKYIKLITAITVSAVLLLQSFWIYNMYTSYKNKLESDMNKILDHSIYMEMSNRNSKLGGGIFYKSATLSPDDYKQKYIRREIITEDSTFYVNVDPRDPNSNYRILQYLLKDVEKININFLDSIFVSELQKQHYQINESYIEYFNLRKDTLIESNKPSGWHYFSCSTNIIPIDIVDSLGVRAHVSSQFPAFLKQMLLQLILSAILIIMACFCLFYLLKTIFTQRKIENLRQDMINAMTHEFKRPIANARGLLNLAEIYLDSGYLQNVGMNIKKADFQLDRLAAYKQQILEINRNEKLIQLELKKIHIWEFIKIYPETYQDAANIFISIETSTEYFKADEIHFTNVIDNLIENAIKYSVGKADITIRIYENNSKLIFSVKDQGIGMSSSEKKYIFEKFYRVNSKAVMKKEGFGLGLTYVKTVIEAHQGHITVESAPEKGSTFNIGIPL